MNSARRLVVLCCMVGAIRAHADTTTITGDAQTSTFTFAGPVAMSTLTVTNESVQNLTISTLTATSSATISNLTVGAGFINALNTTAALFSNNITVTGPITASSITATSAMFSSSITVGGPSTMNNITGNTIVVSSITVTHIEGPFTNWVSYTPAIGGFTSATMSAYWRQVGDTLEVHGYAQATAFTATNLSITLPNAVTIDSTKFGTRTNSQQVGSGTHLVSTGGELTAVFYDGSDTSKVYLTNAYTDGGSAYLKRTASSYFGSTGNNTITFEFSVPISGWSF